MQGASKHNIEMVPSEPGKKQQKPQKSSVGQRWLTALVAMPIVLIFWWFGGWVAFVAALLVAVISVFELYYMLTHAGYHPSLPLSLLLSFLFVAVPMVPATYHLLALEIVLVIAILISFPAIFFRKTLDHALINWALTLAIPVYTGFSSSFFLFLRAGEPCLLFPKSGEWLYVSPGAWWLLVTFLGVWAFDGAAFFTGRYLGRHKLAPLVSPAKTWEGAVGGFVACILTCLIITVNALGIPWYLAVVLGLLIGTAATIGDLAESMIKRQTNVKDSGQIMPGHGGMLDRVDSLLFAVMAVYIFVQVITLFSK